MKKKTYIILICFLIYAFNISAYIVQGRRDGGGGGTPDICYESFDASGYDNNCSGSWAETLAGTPTNAIDEDNTTQKIGIQSALVQIEDNTANGYAQTSITEQTGEHYYQIKLWCIVDSFGADWQSVNMFKVNDGGTDVIRVMVQRESDDDLRIFAWTPFGNSDLQNNTMGEWHTVSVKYYSDGSSMDQFKVDGGTAIDIANESSNWDPDRISIGSDSNDSNTTGDCYVEDAGVCSAAKASDCGW